MIETILNCISFIAGVTLSSVGLGLTLVGVKLMLTGGGWIL